MKQWYTLYTKPNAEYQVAATLQRRGIETYLPEIETPKVQQIEGKEPFFPCYLFAKVDFEKTGLSQVGWTPGLRHVVAFGERPVPLPDQVIDLIRHKLEITNTKGGRLVPSFQPGDQVRITDGPLQGMLAILTGSTAHTDRVQVLLTFLGHVSRAHIPVADLQRVSPEAETPAVKRLRRTRGRGRRIRGS
jgi:transcriptional antiterminator RfaH